MKRNIKFFTLFFCVLICSRLCAQHEICFDGGGGISMMLYRGSAAKKQINIGYAGGLSYSFFSNNRTVAFRTGFEVTNYKAALQINNLKDAYDTYDMDGEPINFRYTVNDYSENISALYLQIPLFFQFMNRGNNLSKHRFYADLGFKIGIPVHTELKISSMNMTSSGYYYRYENEISEPAFMGYGNFDVKGTVPSKVKTNVSVIASVELGMRWHLYHNTLFLYTGLYCDYGLNNIAPAPNYAKNSNYHLINYNPENPAAFTSNSLMLAKETTPKGDVVQMVKRISPLAAGLRIRIGIFIEKPASKMKWAKYI